MSSNRVYDHRPLGSHSHPAALSSLAPGPPPLGLVGGGGALSGASGPPPANPVLGGGGGAHAARLNDLLEFVKAEFEQVSGETGALRAARDEYEAMINHHANEINAMRAIAYDLERKHHDDKRILTEENSRLSDELARLRRELDTRGPGSSTAGGATTPLPVPRPSLPSMSMEGAGPRPGSSSSVGGGERGGPPGRFGEFRREDGGYGGRDEEHLSKRPRTDDEDRYGPGAKGKAPPFSKPSTPSTLPPPGSSFSRPPSTGPGALPPLPSANASNGTTLPPISGIASPAVDGPAGEKEKDSGNGTASGGEDRAVDKFDPENVARDLKKEGSDWMTMFNPNVKRVLDVGLVHTLVHDSVVCCVRFSPDGKTLATGCNRNTTLYDTKTGAKISVFVDESVGVKADNYVRSTSFSPDGKLLATGSEDRIIRIWNIAQKRISKVFQGHKSEIYSLAFSPDGRKLVSGSGDKTARMWDMETGACLFTLPIDDVPLPDNGTVDAGVTSVVISPDGKFLAAGSLDTVVRIWDSTTGMLLDKLKGHKDSVYSVAFSPDGRFLVSGSLDRTLKMWDMNSLKVALAANGKDVPAGENTKTVCMTTLHGHKDYVLSVDISPDGAWIVSGSKDRGVQFWDPVTAKAQFMLQGHKNSVISVAVADVGGLVATGSGDWSARIWSYERLP